MSDSNKVYASFNTLTITGRVYHAEVVKGQYGEFLAVTLMTELTDDGGFRLRTVQQHLTACSRLPRKGWLNNGRRVTVTGHLKSSFTELYFDKKLGKTKRLKNARLILDKAVVFDGGLGPAKKAETEVPSVTSRSMRHLNCLRSSLLLQLLPVHQSSTSDLPWGLNGPTFLLFLFYYETDNN